MRNFEDMPVDIRKLIMFNECIVFETYTQHEFDTFDKFKNFRWWIVNLYIGRDIDLLTVPNITRESYTQTIEYLKEGINVNSLTRIVDDNHIIKRVNGKLEAI